MPVNEYRVPFGGDKNIPKVGSVDGYSSLNMLKNKTKVHFESSYSL